MKLIYSFIIIIFSTFLLNAETVWENQQSSTPSVFKVKPTDMKLCSDFDALTGVCTGNVYTFVKTMTADNGRCDIAASVPGAIACNYGPTKDIPIGIEYIFARIELERTMWLQGTVENETKNNTTSDFCFTNSNNTQSDYLTVSEGSTTSGSASEQAMIFPNGPGNNHFQGNATKTTANTTDTYSNTCFNDDSNPGCAWLKVDSLDSYGSEGFDGTNPGSYDYFNSMDYSTPVDSVWQSGLADSDSHLVIIHRLTSPFTRTTTEVDPLIKMTFDVTDALDAQFVRATEAGLDAYETCVNYVGNPGVSITVTE